MHSDYDLLIAKLDGFIRKYYKDRLIRGSLYAVGLLVAVFLGASLMEYVARFGSLARTLLFWTGMAAIGFIVARFILLPAIKLFRLGPVISHEEAARIVGNHFGDVRDKLLNTLQLRHQAPRDPQQAALILAAIAQRSRELSPVPFSNAIDLRRNRRYLRYALPPIGLLLVVLLAAPSMLTGPATRILHHRDEFTPEAPFRFVILNDSLRVAEEQDFQLLVRLEGSAIPQQVQLDLEGRRIPLVKTGADLFAHRFRNVRERQEFFLSAEGFNSNAYALEVLPFPSLIGAEVRLDYPAYLGMTAATQTFASDLIVPAGTRVTWDIGTRSTDRLQLVFDDTTATADPLADGRFRLTRRMLRSSTYRIAPEREGHVADDRMQHRIEVVPDLYPSIAVEHEADSTALKRLFFTGEVADDHGVKRLVFHYRFVQGGDSVAADQRSGAINVPVDAAVRQRFFHSWDLYGMRLGPGDRIEHWFEVWDNDGVNGSKSTRSATLVFAAPTLKELAEKRDAESEAIQSGLREQIKEAQDLQRELDKLRRDLLEKKEASWQDKQRMEEILDRQRQLQQRIENGSEQLRMSQQQQREFSPMDERLMEKQEQIQQLFENVLSEEMKELYRQVEEMLEQVDKEQLQEQLQDMKLGQEDIEKELDRALEMFKRMEVEQKTEDIAKRLEELAEKQDELSEESKEGGADEEALKQRQDSLNKAFDELRKDLDELGEKNESLEEPMNLPQTEQQEQEIQDSQQQSSDQLSKGQKQKAAGSQKDAAEKMEQLAFQMQSAMQQNAEEQQAEDMDALRQLLENIVELSFDQENLLEDLSRTGIRDPRFIEHGRSQRKLRDDAKVIEDSLFALSKRVPQLQSIVNREMNAVNGNMDEATRLLGEARANERFKPMAADKQQHAMTSLNNLALLLDEALQQMMQQMNMQGKSGNCKKPGNKPGSSSGEKPGMARMRAQQEALRKQLEAMKKAMDEGKKPGEKPGQRNPGGMGPGGMSQQLAQLAAQQAAIRKEMQRMAQELNKDGSGAGNELNKLAQEMEQQERDIVNRNINPETIRRQQDIMTRLLEHEKAERERELDQKRTSNQGRETPHQDPARLFELQRSKQREAELLRTMPPGLKPYYQDRVSTYFGTFDRP